ncbi:homing endonuclease [Vibrio phage D480]|nr:putative endonuclease [Vibrio phage 6E35.1a]
MFEYGHWVCEFEIDPKQYLGFVYVLTMSNGKKYIGAKKIWVSMKRTPASYKKLPKKPFRESNWRSYTSSSKHVNEMHAQGIVIDEFRIVSCHDSWGKTLFAEAMLQIELDAVRSDVYLNKQCGGNFTAACWEDVSDAVRFEMESNFIHNEHTVDHQVMYKLGQRTKYVAPDDVQEYLDSGWEIGRSPAEWTEERREAHRRGQAHRVVKPYTILNTETNETVVITNQNQQAIELGLFPSHLSRLRSGDILKIDGKWTLENTKRPRRYVSPDGREHTGTVQACAKSDGAGLNHETFRRYCAEGLNGYSMIEAESKADYQARLAEEQSQ